MCVKRLRAPAERDVSRRLLAGSARHVHRQPQPGELARRRGSTGQSQARHRRSAHLRFGAPRAGPLPRGDRQHQVSQDWTAREARVRHLLRCPGHLRLRPGAAHASTGRSARAEVHTHSSWIPSSRSPTSGTLPIPTSGSSISISRTPTPSKRSWPASACPKPPRGPIEEHGSATRPSLRDFPWWPGRVRHRLGRLLAERGDGSHSIARTFGGSRIPLHSRSRHRARSAARTVPCGERAGYDQPHSSLGLAGDPDHTRRSRGRRRHCLERRRSGSIGSRVQLLAGRSASHRRRCHTGQQRGFRRGRRSQSLRHLRHFDFAPLPRANRRSRSDSGQHAGVRPARRSYRDGARSRSGRCGDRAFALRRDRDAHAALRRRVQPRRRKGALRSAQAGGHAARARSRWWSSMRRSSWRANLEHSICAPSKTRSI